VINAYAKPHEPFNDPEDFLFPEVMGPIKQRSPINDNNRADDVDNDTLVVSFWSPQTHIELLQDFVYYEFNLDREIGDIIDRFARGDLKKREAVRAIKNAFRMAAEAPMPDDAPNLALPSDLPIPIEKYVGNRGGGTQGETIVEFVRRVWGPHIEAGTLDRAFLRRIDPKAMQAISNFERHSHWPEVLPIPTKSKLIAKRAEELRNDAGARERLRKARTETRRLGRAMGLAG